MTGYSVLGAPSGRATIIATWPGFESEEHSVKVTTVSSASEAQYLASQLTHLSEAAWDAAMWLDTSPRIEAAIARLVEQLRSSESIAVQAISTEGLRHGATWTSQSLSDQLGDADFLSALSDLSVAQRLSVAAEIELDASERAEAVDPDRDGFENGSRIAQAGLVTRVQAFGAVGPLPEGAAGYLRECYGEDLDFGDRWWAARQVRRMEQLVAACNHHGGRARSEVDPCEAHCVIAARPGEISDDDVPCYIAPVRYGPHAYLAGRPNPAGRLRVRRGHTVVAELDPDDTAGFVAVLGDWAATFVR